MVRTAWKAFSLRLLSERLKRDNAFPARVEVSSLGGLSVVSVFDAEGGDAIMHPTATTGVSSCPHTAALKALTEYSERKLVRAFPDEFPHWTEGVAGWDVPFAAMRSRAAQFAREHALSEVYERHIWARWNDCNDFGQEVIEGQRLDSVKNPGTKNILDFLRTMFGGGELKVVIPKCEQAATFRPIIGMFVLPGNDGVVSGGGRQRGSGERSKLLSTG